MLCRGVGWVKSDTDSDITKGNNMNNKYMAETGLVIQDACNASGIVYALARFVSELTSDHPVVILFADRLDDLCRCREMQCRPTTTTLVDLMATFKTTMDRLCQERRGTDWRNQHPETQELVLQLVHLAGSRSTSRFSDAYDACQQVMAVTPTTAT